MTYAENVLRLDDRRQQGHSMYQTTRSQAISLGLSDGESQRTNHEGCGAGHDFKKRLWVVRSSGRVGWKCHHCGEKGSARVEPNRTMVLNRLRPREENPDKIELPYDFDSNFLHWPPEARAWVLKYGIEKPQTWGWSESKGRVIIPVYQDGLQGYQSRKVFPEDPGPKYLTRGRNLVYGPCGLGCADAAQTGPQTGVVVEDALSAEKVGRICDAYALLGTTRFSHGDALKFAQRYAKVLVWFDDNNWQARKDQAKLVSRLNLVVPTVMVRTGKDPKEHTLKEIQEIVG